MRELSRVPGLAKLFGSFPAADTGRLKLGLTWQASEKLPTDHAERGQSERHGGQERCYSLSTKLSRLDTKKNRYVVRWSRTQAPSDNRQAFFKTPSMRSVCALQHRVGANTQL